MRELYSILMALVQPLLRYKLWKRGRQEPGYLVHVGERWGDYRHLLGDDAAMSRVWDESSLTYRPTLWLHAVSLGETRAAAVLLQALRPMVPGMRLLLTHGTATGREAGLALLREGDRQVWLPWDTPVAVDRFLSRFQPAVGVLMETEVWPNLVAGCRERHLPLLLVNARLSPRSLASAQRLAWLARPAYRGLTAVYAQTQADAVRLQQLGAPVADVLGNLKFDAKPAPQQLAQGQQWRARWQAHARQPRKLVLFASSREGEDLLLLQQLAALPQAQRRAIQWLIVPRHPQRFDEVAQLIQTNGFSLSRRSRWDESGPSAEALNADIWLGDSLGEMATYYAMSDVALLGGSFLPLGGQNLIEAAACACPVLMGPHTFNFAEAASNSVQAGAALAVADMDQAVALAVELLQQPAQLAQHQRAALAFVQLHQGAAGKTAKAIAAHC